MERSFASLAGFEHEAELVTGYDDLVSHHEHQTPKTPEAVYTETVLKLEAGTYGIIDGQEGFLDNIKRGATKVYEWIKQLIKSIRDWFFGKSQKDMTEVKRVLPEKVKYFNELPEKIQTEASAGTLPKPQLISAVMTEKGSKAISETINRLPTEDKKIFEGELIQAGEDPEIKEKITIIYDDVIEKIGAKLKGRVTSLRVHEAEIDRLDPSKVARSKTLNLERYETHVSDELGDLEGWIQGVTANRLPAVLKDLLDISTLADKALARGTDNLNKLNQQGGEKSPKEQQQLARAANVLKEYGAISAGLRDLILTLDAELSKGIERAWDRVVKETMQKALKVTSERSARIMADMIANM